MSPPEQYMVSLFYKSNKRLFNLDIDFIYAIVG